MSRAINIAEIVEDEEKLLSMIKDMLFYVYSKDLELIKKDVYEVCFASRFLIYLQNRISDYDVDIEYNKHGVSGKELPRGYESKYNHIRPDIIIHKRGDDDNNQIVFEFKKRENDSNCHDDCSKLKGMTRLGNLEDDGVYNYSYGVRLIYHKEYCLIILIRNGKVVRRDVFFHCDNDQSGCRNEEISYCSSCSCYDCLS